MPEETHFNKTEFVFFFIHIYINLLYLYICLFFMNEKFQLFYFK
jgi:hypothetical protein